MKILLQSLFFFLVVTQICFAQWAQLGLEDKGITDIAARNSSIFAITSDSAVYRSTNNGATWVPIVDSIAIDLAISPSGTLYMVKYFPRLYWTTDSLYRSSDNGNTWVNLNLNEQFPGCPSNVTVSPAGFVFCGMYDFQPHVSEKTLLALSTDDGSTWTTPGDTVYGGDLFDFRGQSVITSGYACFSCADACWLGVWLSYDNGLTWSFLGSPPFIYNNVLSKCLNGNILMGGSYWDPGLFRSSDSCSSWIKVSSLIPETGLSIESGGMLVGNDSLGVFLFSDNGDSLGSFNEGLSNLNAHILTMDNNGYVYLGTDNGLWRRPLSEIFSLASIIPDHGYQTYSSVIQIKGVNTHFSEGSGTEQVWLSMEQETITADSFTVNSNTILKAYFQIPASASLGMWDVNVESSIDGIITKEDGFNILPPPAIIVVNPDSLVVEVLSGSTKTEILTISNQGESNLYFDVSTGYGSNNYALRFDGIDDVVIGPTTEFPVGNSNRTVELWFKRISQPVEEGPLMAYGGWGWDNADKNYGIGVHQSDWFFSQWGSAVIGNTVIQSNQWYHSAVVNVGNDVVLYLNGEIDGSGNLNINTLSNTSFYMGKALPDYDGNRKFNGILDEIRIWNMALTQEDIQASMHQQLTGTEPGLVGYWQFNEGRGITAYDKTDNAQNGSLQGGVKWINSLAPVSPSWLTSSPDSGICLPNSSMDIEILFDATELDSGDYYASIIINNSDPFNPSVLVPVHMIVSTAVGVEDNLNVPLVFNLYQNYPNPFNPTTTIKYSMPEMSKVSLTLFNLLGEEVTTLVNEEKIAGNYSVEFNAASLPSGVYFYQLKAGEYTSVKKMILLK